MSKHLGLVVVAGLLMYGLQAQESISIAEYMTAQAGDTLLFETTVGREIIDSQYFIYSKTNFRNQAVLKRAISDQSFYLEQLTPTGLELYLIHKPDGTALLFDKPLLFIPATIKERQAHRDSTTFTILQNGEKQGTGAILVETNIEGFMTAETPLRNFVNCLIVNTKIIQKGAHGNQEVQEWKVWYAKGIGLVNAIVRTYHLEKTGKASPPQITMYQLQKAYVGGKPLQGKIKRMKE